MRILSRSRLQEMSKDELVRHAENLQYAFDQQRTGAQTLAAVDKQTEQDYRARLGTANAALRETELQSSRERSFYWRIVANIGRGLNVDLPVTAGVSNDEDWRAYAKAVESHVCGSNGTRLLTPT
jgi:hypothetical protein